MLDNPEGLAKRAVATYFRTSASATSLETKRVLQNLRRRAAEVAKSRELILLEFHDFNKAAYAESKPDLARLLEGVTSWKIGTIITSDWSRISSSVNKVAEFQELTQLYRVELIFLFHRFPVSRN